MKLFDETYSCDRIYTAESIHTTGYLTGPGLFMGRGYKLLWLGLRDHRDGPHAAVIYIVNIKDGWTSARHSTSLRSSKCNNIFK